MVITEVFLETKIDRSVKLCAILGDRLMNFRHNIVSGT